MRKASFFKKNLIDGNVLTIPDSAPSNQILISKTTASSLKLKTGDDVGMYFVQNPPRVRRFKIAGIYETGLVKEGVGAGGASIAAMAKTGGAVNKDILLKEIERNYAQLMSIK